MCGTGFAGANCDQCDSNYFGSSCTACPVVGNLVCNSPNGVCNDGIAGAGTCTCTPPYSGPVCNNPQLANVNPSSGRTSGGFSITILGNEFGASQGTVTFTTLTGVIDVTSFISWTNTQIVLSVPPMDPPASGVSALTATSSDSKVSNSVSFTLNAPSVTSVTPSTIPTFTSTLVTVVGTSFGATSAGGSIIFSNVGGIADTVVPLANIVSWSHTSIQFNSVAGSNPFDLRVYRGTPVSAVTSATRVNRALPSVTGTNPVSLSTAGGTVTFNGQNFGTDSSLVSVTIGGSACNSVVVVSDASFTCTYAAGQGADQALIITRRDSGASAGTRVLTSTISFAAPSITSLSAPSSGSLGPCPNQCLNDGDVLQINGANFGVASTLTVTIGGVAVATGSCVAAGANAIVCPTPGTPAMAGINLAVVVSRGSQSATFGGSTNGVTFKGPQVLQLEIASVVTSTETAFFSTSSGGTLTIHGNYFVGTCTVAYGPSDFANQYVCGSVAVVTASKLTCTAPAGVQGNMRVVVTCDNAANIIASAPSNVKLAYPVPQLSDCTGCATSCTVASGATYTSVAACEAGEYLKCFNGNNGCSFPSGQSTFQLSAGGLVTVSFRGANFPINGAVVTYGTVANPLLYSCNVDAGNSSSTTIVCFTSRGAEGPYRFYVTSGTGAGAQRSQPSSFIFTYPTPASITSITTARGCDNYVNGQGFTESVNCSTSGLDNLGNQIVLTVQGTLFGLQSEPLSFTIGGLPCSNSRTVIGQNPQSYRLCDLPAGTGTRRTVIAVKELYSLYARGVDWISYAIPSVEYLRPSAGSECTQPFAGISLENCPRVGGDTITITGTNFGAAGATVLLGGRLATNVVHSGTAPHTQLTCIIPFGVSLNVPLFVLQAGASMSQATTSISYQQCQPGTYSPSQVACTPCAAGFYGPTEALQSCLSCAAGTYSVGTGNTECQNCDPGFENARSGQVQCTPCPVGKVSTVPGSLFCEACDAGKFQLSNTSCAQCELGKYGSQQGITECLVCGANEYAGSAGLTQCDVCPQGERPVNKVSCSQCDTGKYSDYGSVDCTNCTVGKFAPSNGLGQCLDCPAGKYIGSEGAVDCTPCPIGTFAGVQGLSVCEACPIGYFNALEGQTACQPCPMGSFGNDTNLDECFDCPLGKFQAQGAQAACVDCAPGRFANAPAQKVCQFCPGGRYATNPGTDLCSVCNSGKFSVLGSAACTDCALGKFAAQPDSPSCRECPVTRFANTTGLVNCYSCALGRYQDAQGQTDCINCRAGYYGPSEGLFTCTPCAPGLFTLGAQSGCDFCAPGKFVDSMAATICQDCAPGRFNDETGATYCPACLAGTFSNVSGLDECISCAAGRSSSENAPVCTACSPGTYQGQTGASTCLNCGTGTYSGAPASTECTPCSPGTVQPSTGQPSCNPCPPGSYITAASQLTCQVCPKGRYSPLLGSQNCTDCTPGNFADRNGASACEQCTPGKSIPRFAADSCEPCPKGSFSSGFAAVNCTTCVAGKYQGDTQQTSCLSCGRIQGAGAWINVGTYSLTPGATECSECQPGKYQDEINQPTCKGCTQGKYNTNSSMTACSDCLPGTVASGDNSVECTACAPGNYYPNSSGSACVPCSQGRAQSVNGSISCNVCLPGTFTSQSAAPFCGLCSAGYFQVNNESSACFPCPVGKFQDLNGSSYCHSCPPGSKNRQTGQSACEVCQPGFYQPLYEQVECLSCAPGKYQALINAISCENCTEGRISSSAGQATCELCDPGYFTAAEAGTQCQACPMGKYLGELDFVCQDCTTGTAGESIGQVACTICPAGKFALATASQSCSTCPNGRISSSPRQSQCSICPRGQYSNAERTACSTCEYGKYSNDTEVTSCTDCAPGKFSKDIASTSCTDCPTGYANPEQGASTCVLCASDRLVAPAAGQKTCTGCDPHAKSNKQRDQCQCDAGYYMTFNASDAYDVGLCNKCALGMECSKPGVVFSPGGEFGRVDNMKIRAGYWRDGKDTVTVLTCIAEQHCSGKANCDIEKKVGANGKEEYVPNCCEQYRTGKLCASCWPGYKANTITSPCELCPEKQETSMFWTVLAGLMTIIVLTVMYMVVLRTDRNLYKELEDEHALRVRWERNEITEEERKALEKDPYVSILDADIDNPNKIDLENMGKFTDDLERLCLPHRAKPNFTYKMKLLLGFFQITTNLTFVVDTPWPRGYAKFVAFFDFLNLDFVPWNSVGCLTKLDYYEQLIIVTSMPLAVLFFIILLYVGPQLLMNYRENKSDRLHYKQHMKRIMAKFFKLFFFTVFMLYPGVSAVVCKFYVGREVNGTVYLLANFKFDKETVLGDSKWLSYLPYALAMTFIYPLGIPSLFWWILYKNRVKLYTKKKILAYGFLYAAYEPAAWWFESCDMLNKLTLSAMVAFFPLEFQMTIALAWTCFYLILCLLIKPFIRKGDDRLLLLVEVEILMLLITGYVLKNNSDGELDDLTDTTMSVLLITMSCLIMVLFTWMTINNIHKMVKDCKKTNKGSFDDVEGTGEEVEVEDLPVLDNRATMHGLRMANQFVGLDEADFAQKTFAYNHDIKFDEAAADAAVDNSPKFMRVSVMRAIGLKNADAGGLSDPYIELSFLDNEGNSLLPKGTLKTEIIYDTLNPEFAAVFEIKVPEGASKAIFEVWDDDLLGGDDYLGEVVCGIRMFGKSFDQVKRFPWIQGVDKTVAGGVNGEFEARIQFGSDLNAKGEAAGAMEETDEYETAETGGTGDTGGTGAAAQEEDDDI